MNRSSITEASMQSFAPDQTRYEIENLLGEGLNSKVYRATRVDLRGQTRQRVALKFLKDQSAVSILRREFETLMAIRSRHCVRAIAWETLGEQSVLAIEWIDGLTLFDFVAGEELDLEEFQEILRQIHQALCDLQTAGTFHGDLQPKNIMIDREGCLRLIDLASGRAECGHLQATREFAAPETKSRGELHFKCDLFSLGRIGEWLKSRGARSSREIDGFLAKLQLEEAGERVFAARFPENWRAQKCLAQKVGRKLEISTEFSTQVLSLSSADRPKRKTFAALRMAAIAGVLTLSAVTAPVLAEAPANTDRGFAKLSIRSEHWMKIQINGRDVGYTPCDLPHLSAGSHRVSWKSALGAGEMKLTLNAGAALRLVETQSHAGKFEVR